jgi:hypothetical protein
MQASGIIIFIKIKSKQSFKFFYENKITLRLIECKNKTIHLTE